MSIEKRFIEATELRAGEGDDLSLVGYAATFNAPSQDLGGFIETIAPGAFTRALAEKQDVRALYNHADRPLGRTKSGTLVLTQDAKGLRFRCLLDPNQQLHRDLHSSVKRGDIDACSFAFKPAVEKGDVWEDRKDASGKWYISRTLTDVDLFDVSIVNTPAYLSTNVQARAAELAPEIRSIVSKMVEKRAKSENRDADDSLEDYIREVGKALSEKFPRENTSEGLAYPSSYGKYWICETYAGYVIANDESQMDGYVRIPYVEDGDDNYVFGTPVPVEKEWVPSERCVRVGAENRTAYSAHLAALAAQHADQSNEHQVNADAHQDAADSHTAAADALKKAADAKAEEERMDTECRSSMGDCAYEKHSCQNVMVEKRHAWDEMDLEDSELDGDEDDVRAAKKLRKETRASAAGTDKVRTKTVDGKALTAKYFASVGDPERTETWKLPVHDKSHADNAAARFGQTNDIPEEQKAGVLRKIKAAQKKFGETPNPDGDGGSRMTSEEIQDMELRFKLALVAPEVRYSDDQPRDPNGKFGSGAGSAGEASNVASGLKSVTDQEDAHGIKVGDKVTLDKGRTGVVKSVAGNSLHVDTGKSMYESWHATKVGRSFVIEEETRYSDDQPRDDHGRFGEGGGGSIGKTTSGKDIPAANHKVYNEAQKMPKYNGKVSPANAHGRDGGKMLSQRLPEYTKADHMEAYAAHTAAAAEQEQKWNTEFDKAAQETFGRPSQVGDYKISGIGSDKFSTESKDKLREAAHTATDHKEAATAHWYAAGKHGRPE